ncbi:MAG TPA: hypothetical protein VEV39_00435, partial [Gemmatimonadales bacterium]|nr:hypothetical protein [Gemmatimonadales bacterium]
APGWLKLAVTPSSTGSYTPTKTIGTDVVAFSAATAAAPPEARITSNLGPDQVLGKLRKLINATVGETVFHDYIPAVDVS